MNTFCAIIMKLMQFFLFNLFLKTANSIECPTENEPKCKEFWYKIFTDMGANLEEGMKCLSAPKMPLKLSIFAPQLKIIRVDDFLQVIFLVTS